MAFSLVIIEQEQKLHGIKLYMIVMSHTFNIYIIQNYVLNIKNGFQVCVHLALCLFK